MKIMGIDIGTTTVSVVMTDTETGKLLAKETVEHNSFLRSSKPEQKLQDPERIYEIVRELLIKQQKENGLPDGIGFTGQMHGMLYVDASGKALYLAGWKRRDSAGKRKNLCRAFAGSRCGGVRIWCSDTFLSSEERSDPEGCCKDDDDQ